MKYLIFTLYFFACGWALTSLEGCKDDEDLKPLTRTDLLTNKNSRGWHLEGIKTSADATEELPACQADDKMWFASDAAWRHDNGKTPCTDADQDLNDRWAFANNEQQVVIAGTGQKYNILLLESRNLQLQDSLGMIYRFSCGCGK